MGFFDRFRKSQKLDTPEKVAAYMQEYNESASGVKVNEQTAMQLATVYSCVRVLAEAIGKLPLNIYQQNNGRTEKITNTPLAKIMRDGPNDYMTPLEYKELIITHLALRGNHFSYKNRVAGRVVELLPMDPASVVAKLNDNYEPEYEVTFPNGTREVLDQSRIFHIRLFSDNGLNGLSPISYARNTLGLSISAETHGSTLFKNAAQPSGGFSTDAKLSPEVVKDLKDQLDGYRGSDAHKNLILQGGLKWFQTSLSSDDAQFLETRKFQRSEICGLFNVPPHMVGDLEKATFSNIEHQSLDFVRNTLMPYLVRIEQRVNKSLIADQKHYAKFNANAQLRGDMKARAEFYTKMLQNGALSPNEIRRLEDMDERDGGDIYLTPMNMMINGEMPEERNDDSTT